MTIVNSVSRHGPEPADRLWEIGLAAAGDRRLYGAAIFKARVVRAVRLASRCFDDPPEIVLDEGRWVPALFISLEAAVGRDRRTVRFMLTSWASVLPVPKLPDSLGGRREILRLYPLARAELGKDRA